MALTRPRIGQLNTNVFADADPITVLHAGATAANVDVGFLINRANGLVSNVALYWSESGNTFVTAFTSNTGITDSNILVTSYANVTVGNLITVGGVFWANGTPFVSGSGSSGNGGINIIGGSTNPAFYTGTATVTTSPTLVDTLPIAGNVYLQWKATAKDTVNSRYRSGIVDTINDGTNVYYNEYAVIKSNPSFNVVTFTSNISSGNINLWATADTTGTTVAFERTVLGTNTTNGYVNAGNAGPAWGGGYVSAQTTFGSNLVANSATTSTSTTTGALVVAGGVGVLGNLNVGGNLTITGTISSAVFPLILNDISNQFNANRTVFALKTNQTTVTSLVDSKDLSVVVDGRALRPYITELRYPWVTPYDGYCGFRVATRSGNAKVTTTNIPQYLVIYNAPDIGQLATVTQINISTSKQTRRYPYSAATIALGD